MLSEIKPPGTAWQITTRGKAAHNARPGRIPTREPQWMGQTTALARPHYSITLTNVARMEEVRGLFKRNDAIGNCGSAEG